MDAMASWPDRDFGVETRDDTPIETPALDTEEADGSATQTMEIASPASPARSPRRAPGSRACVAVLAA